jgi:Arc/MetJ family transcription regulator
MLMHRSSKSAILDAEVIMRTTVDIDVEELDAVVRLTGAKSRSEAIAAGLRALRERAAARKLIEMYEDGVTFPDATAAPRRRA